MYKKEQVILKADGICFSHDRLILRDVFFEIHTIARPDNKNGHIVSLVGRNGIGKTTLFKILAGLLHPGTGSVKIGESLYTVRAGDIGLVPQHYILFNHRTIAENLKIGARNSAQRLTEKEQAEQITDYVNKFELSEHLDKYPMQLSAGQRQRVSIIQQILNCNAYILLDEPFSGLDPITKEKIMELLVSVSLLDTFKAVVIISHDIESAFAISDTALLLASEKGKPGATIVETIDLLAMRFSQDPELKKNEDFQELVLRVKLRM